MAIDASWSMYEVEDIGLEGRHTFVGFSRETMDLCKVNRNVRNRASLHCMLTNAEKRWVSAPIPYRHVEAVMVRELLWRVEPKMSGDRDLARGPYEKNSVWSHLLQTG